MALKLGALLLSAGVITEEQLEEAMQSQVMFGGKLGTNLVDLGFLTEDYLARFLGQQMKIPFCSGDQLKNIPEKILAILPQDLALKFKAIPIAESSNDLRLAMVNPNNMQAIEEIIFATKKKVLPMIAPEIEINKALTRYYGAETDDRQFRKAKQLYLEDSQKIGALAEKEPPARIEGKNPLPLDGEDSSFPLYDIAEVLTEAQSKEDIFQAIQSPFIEFFERFVILINKQNNMVATEGFGEGFSKEGIEKISIPLKVPTIFRDASISKEIFFGYLPQNHNHQKISNLFQITDAKKPVFLGTIPLVEKVGVMVFADGCKDIDGVANRLDKFRKLGEKAGIAFQVLVLKQKILHL